MRAYAALASPPATVETDNGRQNCGPWNPYYYGIATVCCCFRHSTEKLTMKENSFPIYLLILFPESRRFEVQQYEFSCSKPLISDVLEQLPWKEGTSNTAIYNCCGKECKPRMPLRHFCRAGDLLMTVPKRCAVHVAQQYARKILQNPKIALSVRCAIRLGIRKQSHFSHRHVYPMTIITKLESRGIDTEDWIKQMG